MARGATPARVLALEVTRAVRERDAYVRELLESRRAGCGLPGAEFRFAQVLSFGVVMCQGTLDELIDRNLNSPRDIKPKVRDCLRISAYELLFLDKSAHAAVSQGVELVRHVAKRAAGLANAVLRKMATDAQGFPWGDALSDDAAFARSYGIAPWIAGALAEQYGRQGAASQLAAALEGAPTYMVRCPYGSGETFASDLSAQFVAQLVPVAGTVLEVGAGRGTKTLLMQANALVRHGAAARIDAVDVHAYRAHLLEERMERMGVPGVRAFAGDARDLRAVEGLRERYDAVFVDAPCSGTGTMRRHPEIRWRLQPDGVEELARLQLELLREAAGRVAEGGVLVYATCSVLSRENEQVVHAFLESEEGRGFAVEPVAALDAFGDVPAGWGATEEGFFASVPTAGGPDGHFAAVLRRR